MPAAGNPVASITTSTSFNFIASVPLSTNFVLLIKLIVRSYQTPNNQPYKNYKKNTKTTATFRKSVHCVITSFSNY